MRSPAFQAWIHSMPKFNLVSRLCLPHCFTPIKNYHVAPIVHFPAEEKPNRIFYSDPFTARINIMYFAILKVFWYHPRLSMPFKENLLSSKLENAKYYAIFRYLILLPPSITDWICSSQITLTKRLIWCYLVTLERPLSVKPIQLARTIKTTNRLQRKLLDSLSSPIRH